MDTRLRPPDRSNTQRFISPVEYSTGERSAEQCGRHSQPPSSSRSRIVYRTIGLRDDRSIDAVVCEIGCSSTGRRHLSHPHLTARLTGPSELPMFRRRTTRDRNLRSAQRYPSMPATVIAERIGWDHSIRVLSARVADLRPVYLPVDPASRTSYQAGEIAQCDFWFPDIEVPVWFGQSRTATRLTMVCGYSRWASAVLADPLRGGSVRGLVAAHSGVGGGAAGSGLGW